MARAGRYREEPESEPGSGQALPPELGEDLEFYSKAWKTVEDPPSPYH